MTEKPPYYRLKRAQKDAAKAANHADFRVIFALQRTVPARRALVLFCPAPVLAGWAIR